MDGEPDDAQKPKMRSELCPVLCHHKTPTVPQLGWFAGRHQDPYHLGANDVQCGHLCGDARDAGMLNMSKCQKRLVDVTGIEPVTPCLQSVNGARATRADGLRPIAIRSCLCGLRADQPVLRIAA